MAKEITITENNSKPCNILLVDDKPENLESLEVVLSKLGQNLVKAQSGNEALRLILKYDFAVILLDVQMPGMDGFETAAMIHERERSSYTPILFITAIDKSEEHVKRGYTVGAVDYIFKPFKPEILLAKVEKFIELYQIRSRIKEQSDLLRAANAELERRSLDLQVVNSELEAFSYSLSHDLRTPLRAITGFTNALKEDYLGSINEEGQELMNRIIAATGRMNEMIDGMLDLARVSRGDLVTGIVELGPIAREIAAELQKTDPKRKVHFVIPNDVVVAGDHRLLRSVLQNLLSNAWKFTSKHESARIEFGVKSQEIKPSVEKGNQEGATKLKKVYFVQDDGAGFNPAYAKDLFTAFKRLHSQEDFPGVGIGLATAARIICRHGGRIWAEGQVEKGATFYFALPD